MEESLLLNIVFRQPQRPQLSEYLNSQMQSHSRMQALELALHLEVSPISV